MEAFLKKSQHDLKVFSFEEIKLITGDFDKNNLIGEGGFGKVYRGVVDSDSKGQTMAAFKRLDRSCGQGNPEFMKEILMLSHYRHENLITLLGYCDKDPEKILVYEHAARGSLDVHLSSTTLTWTQRLKICLGAARGLCYLHDPNETKQRVIHRDLKSSNILLDENWNAKISDMGLSKTGSANSLQSFLATNVVGTIFYIDPEYMETTILTKESDVYSFGVVLFEVLCGSLCYEYKNGLPQRFVRRWTNRYKENKVEDIIFHHLKQSMDPKSMETFSEIVYRCLQICREDRPYMSQVVEKLETALHSQQEFSKRELKDMVKDALAEKELEMLLSERFFNKEISEKEFEEMVEVAVNKEELEMLISKRFINKEEQELFLSKGVLWFSLDKNGGHCEMISGDGCGFISTFHYCFRIGISTADVKKSRFKVHKQDKLCAVFKTHARAQFLLPGISYTVQHEQVLEEEEADTHPDAYWEQKLPNDWEKILKKSSESVQWTTKKELYSILSKGFLINDGEDGEKWFSLEKNGKICQMLSARNAAINLKCDWRSLSDSRFRETACNPYRVFQLRCGSCMLAPQTIYATYLVYNLKENHSHFKSPLEVSINKRLTGCYIYLLSPDQPLVVRGKVYQKKRVPQLRNDGWMKVPVYEFRTESDGYSNYVGLEFRARDNMSLKGLIVEGVESRPI
ncbi:hypothetical protein LXL04_005760 [Taraxacum kok-saghyz]